MQRAWVNSCNDNVIMIVIKTSGTINGHCYDPFNKLRQTQQRAHVLLP